MNKSAPISIAVSSTGLPQQEPEARRIPIFRLGISLAVFLSITFSLCVLFDLWFPDFAMNSVWAPLLPGFVWISWSSFAIGLLESFAYGWYFVLLFAPLYNFLAARATQTVRL